MIIIRIVCIIIYHTVITVKTSTRNILPPGAIVHCLGLLLIKALLRSDRSDLPLLFTTMKTAFEFVQDVMHNEQLAKEEPTSMVLGVEKRRQKIHASVIIIKTRAHYTFMTRLAGKIGRKSKNITVLTSRPFANKKKTFVITNHYALRFMFILNTLICFMFFSSLNNNNNKNNNYYLLRDVWIRQSAGKKLSSALQQLYELKLGSYLQHTRGN